MLLSYVPASTAPGLYHTSTLPDGMCDVMILIIVRNLGLGALEEVSPAVMHHQTAAIVLVFGSVKDS